jgi:hypothetical protein
MTRSSHREGLDRRRSRSLWGSGHAYMGMLPRLDRRPSLGRASKIVQESAAEGRVGRARAVGRGVVTVRES